MSTRLALLALVPLCGFLSSVSAQSEPRFFASYLGGTARDNATAIAVAANGDLVVAGHTESNDFPVTAGALQTTRAGTEDAFVARLSADGTRILAATFLGGVQPERVSFVHVAQDTTIWVGGTTNSSNFPTTPDAFATFGGRSDAFVVQLDQNLTTLLYGTTFGRVATDTGDAFAIDEANQLVYLAGITGGGSTQSVPVTTNAVQRTLLRNDAYVAILDRSVPNTTSLKYGTLLGGSGFELELQSLSVDGQGVATITGTTNSTDFPRTAGAVQSALGGTKSAFVSSVDPSQNGSAGLVYSSYFGGSDPDTYLLHDVDATGLLHLLLVSSSPDLPATPNALQGSAAGGRDVFYAQLDRTIAGAAAVRYGSWIVAGPNSEGVTVGNFANQVGAALALGPAEVAIWVSTFSGSGVPTTSGAFQTTGGGAHSHVTVLDLGGAAPRIRYASHFKGCGGQVFSGQVALDGNGDLLLVGWGDEVPVTPGAAQLGPQGNFDGLVARLEPAPWPRVFTVFGAACAGTAGTPTLAGTSAPRICGTLGIQATGLPAAQVGALYFGRKTTWGGMSLPFSLQPLGAPGCFIHVGLTVVLGMSTGSGTVNFSAPVGNVPELYGQELFAQFVSFDPGANRLGVVTTNGLGAAIRW